MSKKILNIALLLAAGTALLNAQKVKNQKEADAVQKIGKAANPDERIAAVEALVTNFADTEFKGWAFYQAAESEEQKNDHDKAIFYGEKAIEADPKNYDARLLVAGELARTTRETDLDKDVKLGKAEKYAKEAMDLIPAAVKPSAQVPDEQWTAFKKDSEAQGHIDLGMIAMVRKKYDVAQTEFKTAIDTASAPDTVAMVRLANAYNEGGKADDALSTLNKVLATPNLNPQIKQFAESEKSRAEKAKAAKK